MIKRLTAIVLLIALMSTHLSKVIVFAEFKFNQDYIAAVLCINKDKPQKHCNGKCYLMKQLKEADDKEKKQEQQAHKKGMQDVYLMTPVVTVAFVADISIKGRSYPYSIKLPQMSAEIPHPPPSILS